MPSRPLPRFLAVALATAAVVSLGATSAAARTADTRGRATLCEDAGATLRGTGGPDHLVGTDGDDIILGFAGDDVIEGLAGDDIICGGDGSDLIDAGDGSDEVAQGDFDLDPDPAELVSLDIVSLGAGDDDYFGWADGSAFVDGGPGADGLIGSPHFDLVVGGDGADDITGGAGDDLLFGGLGPDVIRPSEGQDFVDGGDDDDTIDGGTASAGGLDPARPFAAAAESSLLRVDVSSTPFSDLPRTSVDLARSAAVADSDGDVADTEAGEQRTAASATTSGQSDIIGAPIDLPANVATAPPSEANEDVAVPLALAPLFSHDLMVTSAIANWASDGECVASDRPLSLASQTLVDTTVVEMGPDRSVAALDVDESAGAAAAEVATALVANGRADDGRDVQARVATRVAGLDVLTGMTDTGASAIHADVVQNPDYVVVASGVSGGAAVIGADPVVEVSIGGSPAITLTAGEPAVTAPLVGVGLGEFIGGVSPILAALQPVARLSVPLATNAAADGTEASVSGTLLKVEILPPELASLPAPVRDMLAMLFGALGRSLTEPLAVVELAPFAASAQAPAGGLTCGAPEPGDMLVGAGGHDVIQGGPGGDFLIGGDGHDYLAGRGGDDLVLGLAGTDVLVGGDGVDHCDGGDDVDLDAGDPACETSAAIP